MFFLADFMLRRYGDETGARLYYASTMRPYMAYLLAQANQTATPYILDYGLGDWCDANTIVSDDCSPDGQLTSTRAGWLAPLVLAFRKSALLLTYFCALYLF